MSFIDERVQPTGLTFDDVLLVPAYSEVLPREVNVTSRFSRNIKLNIPIVSAAMDTVTEAPLAIALAREGGIGVIHKNMSIAEQAAHVRRVKRAENGMIYDPITISKEHTVGDALALMQENKIGGIPVIDAERRLIGIVTNRDLRFQRDMHRLISEVMTSENLITTHSSELAHAADVLLNNKIEKLPVVDNEGKLVGLITYKDITKVQDHPNACKDSKGRLRVAAGVGVTGDSMERVDALVGEDVDAIVLDSAHGHSANIVALLRRIKAKYPELDVVVGNIATKITSDTVIFYVNSATHEGFTGGTIAIADDTHDNGTPGQITSDDQANVRVIASTAEGHTDEWAFILVDVNNKMAAGPVRSYSAGDGAVDTVAEINQLLTDGNDVAITGNVTLGGAAISVPADRTLTITGNLANTSQAMTVDGTLNVTGTLTATSVTLNDADASLNVDGAVSANVTVTAANTVEVGNITGTLDVDSANTVKAGNVSGAISVKDAAVTVDAASDNITVEAASSGKTSSLSVASLNWSKTISNAGTLTVRNAISAHTSAYTITGGTWVFSGMFTTDATNATTIAASTTVYFNGGITFSAADKLIAADDTSATMIVAENTTATTNASESKIVDTDGTAITSASIAGKTFKGDAPLGWKCRNCGYIHEGPEAPDVCPCCAHPKAYFERKVENY